MSSTINSVGGVHLMFTPAIVLKFYAPGESLPIESIFYNMETNNG